MSPARLDVTHAITLTVIIAAMHQRLRPLLALVSVGSISLVTFAAPTGAMACTGGIAFEEAVAHERGGIVRGIVESRLLRADFSEDVVISDAAVVRGDPPLDHSVNAAAGLPCEQVADTGETIMLIYDVRGQPVHVPLYYVVEGQDALSAAVVASALATTPQTDTDPATAGDPKGSFDWTSLATLASVGAAGFALAARRARRSRP